MRILLSTAYLPPIQYFCKLINNDEILIESNEHFNKQSYRNRCRILGPNGVQSLSIPIARHSGKETLIKDITIDYSMSWQANHFRSILTAYKSSPYYDYYIDELAAFYENKEKYLFDYNYKIMQVLFKLIQINPDIKFTEVFEKFPEATLDYRNSIHPKVRMRVQDDNFYPEEYTQVFAEKHEFQKNLSILDLLMNEGPMTIQILKSCLR